MPGHGYRAGCAGPDRVNRPGYGSVSGPFFLTPVADPRTGPTPESIMKRRSIFALATAALLLLGAGQALAADSSGGATPPAQGKASAPTKGTPSAKPQAAASSAKASAEVKPIDINSASSQQLKTLPGITAAEVEKLIAGRPYGSKSQLVSRGIVSEATYQGLRPQIVAKQPYKDASKNAALQAKPK